MRKRPGNTAKGGAVWLTAGKRPAEFAVCLARTASSRRAPENNPSIFQPLDSPARWHGVRIVLCRSEFIGEQCDADATSCVCRGGRGAGLVLHRHSVCG